MPETDREALLRAQELHRTGRLRDAAEAYRAALAGSPDNADLQEWYGILCLQMGRGGDGLTALQRAVALVPGAFSYCENLAGAAVQLGETGIALSAMHQALRLRPQEKDLRRRFVRLLLKCGHPDDAMAALEPMVHGDPVLQARCRDPDQAGPAEARQLVIVENCRYILARYPEYAPAHYALACAQLALGAMADAVAAAQAAIQINPGLPVYYHVALTAGTPSQKLAAVAALERLRPHVNAMPRDGAAMLHFLLGSAYDKAGRFADAFAEMEAGNRIKRALIRYDGLATLSAMRNIADQFPAGMFSGDSPAVSAGMSRPIFIVGMYRSGTSLIEQILASHPGVYGAGEITLFPQILAEVLKTSGHHDPADLTEADYNHIGDLYRVRLKSLAPQSSVIVDKLPDNFLRLGWIARALPEARVVHVARDPLDCCLSCYAHMFAGNIGYAYDLTELGQYYRGYRNLMRHWAGALPPGLMYTQSYEALVRDPEPAIRNLLSACGLSWDSACLNFSNTRRAVTTASVGEVRQPLFKSSVGRAGPYLRWLSPLIRALG